MAEPLKNQFGLDVPKRLAAMMLKAWPSFAVNKFVEDCAVGYDALELTARARHIAHVLARYLPKDFEQAVTIIVASLGPPIEESSLQGLGSFIYLPHTYYIAEYGKSHFAASMAAQYQITQRFTAEFSIRTFIERYTDQSLELLHQWSQDPNVHVRRLVSEGTRPRLPWAGRLRMFQKDPRPVLALLEKLKDDPDLYVRRSVANNLNDIGKDHPQLLIETCRKWKHKAPVHRQWVIRHALRSAVKSGVPGAIELLGFNEQKPRISLTDVVFKPKRLAVGKSVNFSFVLRSRASKAQKLLIDFRVHYVKANGSTAAKVFKLTKVTLEPSQKLALTKSLSTRPMTTRKHYPGIHRVDILVNGHVFKAGEFRLV